MSNNKLRVNLSAFDMTICQGVLSQDIPIDPNALSQLNLQAHTDGA